MSLPPEAKAAIARFAVQKDGKQLVGTGWLVSPQLVLTCWHVVRDLYGLSGPKAIDCQFPAIGKFVKATFDPAFADEKLDVALLRTHEALDSTPFPIVDLAGMTGIGLPWSTWGFPSLDPEGIGLSGRITDTTVQLDGSEQGIQLNVEEGISSEMGGISGAPIVCGGMACGMVSDSPPGAARVVYGRPIREICERFSSQLEVPRSMPRRVRRELVPPKAHSTAEVRVSPQLVIGLRRLWARNRQLGYSVQTFDKLLLVNSIAPDYFVRVFDEVKDGLSGAVLQWIRAAAANARPLESQLARDSDSDAYLHDPALAEAEEIAKDMSDPWVLPSHFLLALLGDKQSKTIARLRESLDQRVANGFALLESHAEHMAPRERRITTKIPPLDF